MPSGVLTASCIGTNITCGHLIDEAKAKVGC